jgi:hypothetical protein
VNSRRIHLNRVGIDPRYLRIPVAELWRAGGAAFYAAVWPP